MMKKAYGSSENTGAPFSEAIEANGLVFLSGQIHISGDQLVGDTIEQKFEAAMKNITAVLAQCHLTAADIVRVQLYLTNLADLPALNKVYADYFTHPLPVRTAIGVAALPLGASLEVDIVACRS